MEAHLKTATIFANILDNQFSVFGKRFGLTAFLDLIPGIGDVIAYALSFYIVWIGIQMNVPGIKILEMLINITINFFIGLIPVAGDIAYIFRRANMKNLQILKEYAGRHVIEGEIVKQY